MVPFSAFWMVCSVVKMDAVGMVTAGMGMGIGAVGAIGATVAGPGAGPGAEEPAGIEGLASDAPVLYMELELE